MLTDILFARSKQGYQTMAWPCGPPPQLPARFTGRPRIDSIQCGNCSGTCVDQCPTGAITHGDGKLRLDLGRCIFCRSCEKACGKNAISFGRDYQLAAAKRKDLIVENDVETLLPAFNKAAATHFSRSFSLRVISAGGCGACEADTNVLTTLAWDISRFGIHYAASPRHADGVLIIGPVTANMAEAVRQTHDAVPSPKCVIAVGTCAVSGGIYAGMAGSRNGCDPILPVDLYIPGCPPHPLTILDGLLRFLGRIP